MRATFNRQPCSPWRHHIDIVWLLLYWKLNTSLPNEKKKTAIAGSSFLIWREEFKLCLHRALLKFWQPFFSNIICSSDRFPWFRKRMDTSIELSKLLFYRRYVGDRNHQRLNHCICGKLAALTIQLTSQFVFGIKEISHLYKWYWTKTPVKTSIILAVNKVYILFFRSRRMTLRLLLVSFGRDVFRSRYNLVAKIHTIKKWCHQGEQGYLLNVVRIRYFVIYVHVLKATIKYNQLAHPNSCNPFKIGNWAFGSLLFWNTDSFGYRNFYNIWITVESQQHVSIV